MLHELFLAVRSLRRDPGLVIAVSVTLALGIGANSAIFSIVHTVLLRPLPVADQERLVVIWEEDLGPERHLVEVSLPNFEDWRDLNRSFEVMAAMGSSRWGFTILGEGDPLPVSSRAVSASFFETLGVEAWMGRTFRPEDDQPGAAPVVVLSHRLWQSRFGSDPDIVGRSILVEAGPEPQSATIIGVMGPEFRFPHDAELWSPVGPVIARAVEGASFDPRGLGVLYVVGRLKANVSSARAEAELDGIVSELAAPFNRRRGAVLTPLVDYLFGQTRSALVVLFAAVSLVLLIACANVAGLLLVRALGRQKEVAVRRSLGASRLRILGHALAESIVLAGVGGILGLALAQVSLKAVVAQVPAEIPRLDQVSIDGSVLAFAVGLSALTALLVAAVPGRAHRGDELTPLLREGGMTLGGARRVVQLRRAFVVGEVALAMVLMTGAGLMLRSFLALRGEDFGYRTENVLSFRIGLDANRQAELEARRELHRRLLERFSAHPSILSAGAVSLRPFELGPIGSGMSVQGEGQSESESRDNQGVFQETVTPDYFRAMGMPLVRGRGFTERDDRDVPPRVIVSAALAERLWPGEDPIGKRLRTPTGFGRNEDGKGPWQRVIGVVSDARNRDIEKPQFDLYWSYLQVDVNGLHYALHTEDDPLALVPMVRAQVRALAPQLPIEGITTLERIVAGEIAPWRFNMILFGFFGAVALGLTLLGVFGVVAYGVKGRRRELALRMALGARRAQILRLVLGEGVMLTSVGLALGLLLSLAASRFVESLLFEVSASDPATYLVVGSLLPAVALAASLLPARRATVVSPADVLRHQ